MSDQIRPEDVLDHGHTPTGWRNMLFLETLFAVLMLAGVLAVFAVGLAYSQDRLITNVGVIAVSGAFIGVILHHFRHLRTDVKVNKDG